ncbi:MAG: peptidase S41 [Bacteroidetes bacterium]|nr:MAG: peptidase S41 [Bacteroidota bacterium]
MLCMLRVNMPLIKWAYTALNTLFLLTITDKYISVMRRFLTIIFLIALFSSCEKVLFEKDYASSDPFDNFEYLWNEVDKKYSYHDLKGVDWDAIKVEYKAKLHPGMSEDSLFNVLAAMLNKLRDDHVNLVAPFNISFYNVDLTGPSNLDFRTLREHYMGNAHYTGPFAHTFLADNRIGYMRYGSFTSDVDEKVLDHVLTRYKDTEGLILDLRANGGGSIFNIPKILERFNQQNTLVAYTITRNGPNKGDFGPREPFYIGTHNGISYNKPVMVLIDRASYSATTFFALTTKSFPNITLIGDTTGGGGGIPAGGQLPNGWTYRFSISQVLDLNGNNYAEEGVEPDIAVNFDWSDLTKDEILERAIEEILN